MWLDICRSVKSFSELKVSAAIFVAVCIQSALIVGCSKPQATTNLEAVYAKPKGGIGRSFSKSDLKRIVGSYDPNTLAQGKFKSTYSGGHFSGQGTFKGIRQIKLFIVSPVAVAVIDGVTISCIMNAGSDKAKRISRIMSGQIVFVSGRLDGVGKNSLQIGNDDCDYRPSS